jgi:hypothetical protein
MEEETGGLAREATRSVKDELGRNQDVGDVGGVNFSGDGSVVAGGAGVFEHGAAIRSDPDKTEDGSVQVGRGGSEVADGEVRFGNGENLAQMERGVRGVANGNGRLRQ